jgi:hypothetical protein
MKIYWSALVVAGTLGFLILYLADREREASIEWLSNYTSEPHSKSADESDAIATFPERTQPTGKESDRQR